MNRIAGFGTTVATALLALAFAAPANATQATLGPDGYKSLYLGQTGGDAEATGLLVDKRPGECDRYRLRPEEGDANIGSGVFVDQRLGVVVIGGTTKSHTPEGTTIGSPLDSVRAAYPELEPVPPTDFVYRTPVPNRADRYYRFAFDEADRVTDFALEAKETGTCTDGQASH